MLVNNICQILNSSPEFCSIEFFLNCHLHTFLDNNCWMELKVQKAKTESGIKIIKCIQDIKPSTSDKSVRNLHLNKTY